MCLTQCSRQKSNSAVKGWPYWKRVDKEVPENGRRTGGGMLREFRKEARVWGRWWMLLPPVERKLNMLQSISQKLGRVAKLEGEEMEEAEGCQLPPRYQRREMSYCAIFAREWKICRTSLRIAFIIPLLLLLLLFFFLFFYAYMQTLDSGVLDAILFSDVPSTKRTDTLTDKFSHW